MVSFRKGASHVCVEGTDVIQMPSDLFLSESQRIQSLVIDPIKLDLFGLLHCVRLWVMQRNTL